MKEGIHTEAAVFAPSYYKNFSCKCGDCRHVCCGGWGITLSEREYYRLIGIECSEKLRERLDRAFHLADYPTKERFALISPNYEGKCPILREDGYCALQKEKGEDVLPIVCRMYPRSIKKGFPSEAVMSASCELTVELLTADDEPLSFEEEKRDLPFAGLESALDTPEKLRMNRECIALLSDRRYSLKDRIRLLGEKVTGKTAVEEGSGETALLTVLKLIGSYRRTSVTVDEFADTVFPLLGGEPDEIDPSFAFAFLSGKRKELEAHYPKAEIWLEKILANHLFYTQFPYAEPSLSPEKNYTAFAVAFAFLAVVLPLALIGKEEKNDFVDLVSDMFRFSEHSSLYSIGKYRVIPDGLDAYRLFAPLF